MRTAVAAVAATLSTLPFAPPAAAQGALTVTCVLRYESPARDTEGTGNCDVTGMLRGTVLVAAAGTMSFSAVNGCPTQSANGALWTAGFALNFTWTRIGPQGAITTAGDVNGGGSATFSGPCPVSRETAVFTIAGA